MISYIPLVYLSILKNIEKIVIRCLRSIILINESVIWFHFNNCRKFNSFYFQIKRFEYKSPQRVYELRASGVIPTYYQVDQEIENDRQLQLILNRQVMSYKVKISHTKYNIWLDLSSDSDNHYNYWN